MGYKTEDIFRKEYDLVCSVNSGGGYEWSTVEVWKRPGDTQMFMYADSGCSCNSPYEHVNRLEDLQPVSSFDQVRKAIEEEIYEAKPGMIIEAYQKFERARREKVG